MFIWLHSTPFRKLTILTDERAEEQTGEGTDGRTDRKTVERMDTLSNGKLSVHLKLQFANGHYPFPLTTELQRSSLHSKFQTTGLSACDSSALWVETVRERRVHFKDINHLSYELESE